MEQTGYKNSCLIYILQVKICTLQVDNISTYIVCTVHNWLQDSIRDGRVTNAPSPLKALMGFTPVLSSLNIIV